MRILIAGMGDLGAEIGRRGLAEGHEVLGLRRSAAAPPAGVLGLRADVTDPRSLDLPGGIEAAVYCVAADARDDDAYRRAYPLGLANVLGALERSGSSAARVLFVSSTGVYGDAGGEWVDERTETAPPGFTGRRMCEAEAVLEASAFAGTSLRLGGIYGPGRTYLLDAVARGRPFPADALDRWTNRVHRDDAARAVLHLLGLPEVDRAVNVVDREPARRRDVLGWIAGRVGAELVTGGSGGVRSDPADRRVSSELLVRRGFVHRFPSFREGYAELLGSAGGATPD